MKKIIRLFTTKILRVDSPYTWENSKTIDRYIYLQILWTWTCKYYHQKVDIWAKGKYLTKKEASKFDKPSVIVINPFVNFF